MEPGPGVSGGMLSRRQVLRGAAGLGLVAATGSLWSACGSGGGDGDAAAFDEDAPLETTSIRLHSVPPVTCIAAEFMAEKFMREAGFTDIQYPSFPAATVVDDFANGEIDLGLAYAASIMPLIEAGAPLVMIGGVHVGCWQVVATGDIKSMSDFSGKTVAISSLTSTDGIFMAMNLANVGLDLRKDVKLVNYPPVDNARILAEGLVDAVVAFPPISLDLRAKGIGNVVVNSPTDRPWSNYYCCTAVANRHWLEKNPVAAKRALAAILKGADVVAKDPEGAARHMVDRQFTNNYDFACDILKEIPYDIWRDFDHVDSVRFYALRLKEAGLIKSTPDEMVERGTDFRYIAHLKREMKEV